jgi:hypothetical protein
MRDRLLLDCFIPDRQTSFTVELLKEEAPVASRILAEMLPINSDSFHTKWNGAELFLVLPRMEQVIEENLKGSVETGDVFLFHRDGTYRAAPKNLRSSGLGAYTELAFFYGTLIRSYGPDGPVTGTRVGRIIEGLEDLELAARTMRRDGFGPMRVKLRS